MRFITKTTLSRAVLAVSTLTVLAGCGLVKPVQPWEKGTLARPEMTFEGDKLDAKFTEHIYGSKEGASGGAGVRGAGRLVTATAAAAHPCAA